MIIPIFMISLAFVSALLVLAALYGTWRVMRGPGSWQRKLLKIGGSAVAVAALLYLAYPGVFRSYRMTFEVETPEGVRTGSGVVRLSFGVTSQFLGSRNCAANGIRRGEAIAVDLGARGTFYALLIGRDPAGKPGGFTPQDVFIGVLATHVAYKMCERASIYKLMFVNAAADVPEKYMPFLVRFRDENDPKTVEAVDPKNLAASFGDGVRLKRVTIETTYASVTTGIEKRLTWLPGVKKGSLDGSRITFHDHRKSLPNSLHYGNFLR